MFAEKKHCSLYCTIWLLILAASAGGQESPYLSITMPEKIEDFAFSPDGQTVGVVAYEAQIWDVKSKSLLRSYLAPVSIYGTTVPEPLGKIRLSSHGEIAANVIPGKSLLAIWDTRTGETRQKFEVPIDYEDLSAPLGAMDLTWDGTLVTIVRGDNVYVFSTADGRLVRGFENVWGMPYTVHFINRDNLIFFPTLNLAQTHGAGVVFDILSGRHVHDFNGLIYAEKKNWVVDGIVDDKAGIVIHTAYDAVSGEKVKEWRMPYENNDTLFDISPDGKHIVFGKDKQMMIQKINDSGDLATVRIIPYSGPTPIDGIRFSGDGKMLGVLNGNRLDIYDVSDLTSKIKEKDLY